MSDQMNLWVGRREWYENFDWPNLVGHRLTLGFDTETTGLDVYGESVACGFGVVGEGVRTYFPFRHEQGPNLDPDACLRWARDNLADGTKTLVMANSKFDLAVMAKDYVNLEGVCEHRDVQHEYALQNSERYARKDLNTISQEILGRKKIELDADGLKIHERLPETVAPYCINDAELALDLDEKLMPKIREWELEKVFELETDLTWAVIEMERNGLRLDIEKLLRWQEECHKRYIARLWKIRDLVGFPVDPGKAADKLRLFEKYKLPLEETEAGKPSFTMEHILKFTHLEPMRLLAEALDLSSFDSKYLSKYAEAVGSDGIIRFSLHQLNMDEGGTITGRFSASGPSRGSGIKGLNPQQVFKAKEQKKRAAIKDMIARELFIPDDGSDFFSADASQIEYRFFGHYVDDEFITQRYLKDPSTDFHQILADMISEDRDLVAKHANFAALFGAGLEKFAYMINKSVEDAKPIWNNYHRMVPGVKRLQQTASSLAERRGYIRTIMGRRRWFPDRKFHAAINTVCQGSAADYAKLTVLDAYRHRREYGIKLRCVVHDEIVGDCPMAPSEWKDRFKDFLNVQRLPLKVPITWDVKTGRSWHL